MTTNTALIVVDVNKTFCEGGLLAVPGGNDVAERIRHYIDAVTHGPGPTPLYDLIVFTRDWHIDPGDHFAAPGEEPDFVTTFPVHGVAGTRDAEFHDKLGNIPFNGIAGTPTAVISKGQFAPAFSGFEGTTDLGVPLATLLRGYGITSIDVCGIATEFCDKATALDGVAHGFHTTLLTEFCVGLDADMIAAAITEMADAGVFINDPALIR